MAKKSSKQRESLPDTNPERHSDPQPGFGGLTPEQIVNILEGYRKEADENRKFGPNARDDVWRNLVNLYWNNFDFSKKADWQAREVMPEVPMFVDRFAAAMREALTSTDDFFVVDAAFDAEDDLANAVKRLMKVWLGRVGRDPLGHPVDFGVVFEEQMKLGAMMTTNAVVTYKGDGDNGYVAIDTMDPRTVWLDTTGRNLYRVRRYPVEKTDLMRMARMNDGQGQPLYDLQQLEMLAAYINEEEQRNREQLAGTGQQITSTRKPILIDEYLCTIISPDGREIARNVLCVVANERFLIRGPEANPFWHGEDWIVAAPLVTAPLSVYGRSYIENIGTIAHAFNELTNLILDGTFTTAMKAFAAVPDALEDPTQIDEGIWPNKLFKLEGGSRAADFIKEIELGELPAGAVQVWQTLKAELQEAAAFNDISLGQFAPNSRTSAAEVITAEQNSTALIRSIAKNVEMRFLEPLLGLLWKTGLQHMREKDPVAQQVVGEAMYATLYKRRKELASMPISFRVRGISALVARVQKLQSLLNMLQTVSQAPQLLQAFMQHVGPDKLVLLLFKLYNIDPAELEPSERDALMQQLVQQRTQAAAEATQAGAQPAPAPAVGTSGAPSPGEVIQQAVQGAAQPVPQAA